MRSILVISYEFSSSLFGVCGGLAEYFDVDPTLIRILTAALCTTGTGLLLYIVAAVVMPERIE